LALLRCADGLWDQVKQHLARFEQLRCGEVATSETSKTAAKCEDAVIGTWTWAFAPPGSEPSQHGSVTFGNDGKMSWTGGSYGAWSCSGSTVSLTWKDKAYADTMTLSTDGKSMSGHNNDGWAVTGTR